MIELGLSRITRLLGCLGDPQNTFKAFHVAGTNGKGSVVAYIASALQASGFRTGRFTSPHLVHEYDAIEIDSQQVCLKTYNEAHVLVDCLNMQHGIGATEFELQTAVAFEVLRRSKVDVAAIEVGLGGALDATNVLSPSNVLCCAITKIALDHEAILGRSLEHIAKHKAGIAKHGVPLVIDGSNDPQVLHVVQAEAKRLECPKVVVAQDIPNSLKPLFQNALLPGRFQKNNAAVALAALQVGIPALAPENIAAGFSRVRWTGRLEKKMLDGQEVLIDGAHNTSSAMELAFYVDENLRKTADGPVCWVVAFSKPPKEILQILVKPGDRVIATEFSVVEGMPWIHAQPAKDIARIAAQLTDESLVEILVDPKEIRFDRYREIPTVICGSLYVLKEFIYNRD